MSREYSRAYYHNNKERERARHAAYLATPTGRFSVAKSVARQSKRSLDLSLEDYFSLIDCGCVYCNRPITTAGIGLDRIDNSRGYERDNIQPCCHECNMTRGDRLTVEEMHVVARALAEFRGYLDLSGTGVTWTHTTTAP